MRIRVHHETRFRFDAPVKSVIQSLRLTPRNHEGQHVAFWRIDIDVNCRLKASEDAFGNLTHMFDCQGPIAAITVEVTGEVETFDAAGVLRGTVERFPSELYLRETPITAPDAALRAFAEEAAAGRDGDLDRLHALLDAIHEKLGPAGEPSASVPNARAVFARGSGTAVDCAHVFIAAARHLDIPSRFVGGYFPTDDATTPAAASGSTLAPHAWAEAFAPGLGWVGFDPFLGYCPEDRHVRVAIALDHLGVTPIRAAYHGAAEETVDSRIRVTLAEPPRPP
jgi:transglutaminase-like putative cysteine protease